MEEVSSNMTIAVIMVHLSCHEDTNLQRKSVLLGCVRAAIISLTNKQRLSPSLVLLYLRSAKQPSINRKVIMDSDDEKAILDWVNTFTLPKNCDSLNDLSDGTLILHILADIAPSNFDRTALCVVTDGNWALCATNLKKLLRLIDHYYKSVLHKKVDISNVEVQGIAKANDTDAVLDVFELVVGAAVMCEAKAKFIQNIFALNHASQTVLKGLVEQAMQRMQPYQEGDDDDDEETEAEVVKREEKSTDVVVNSTNVKSSNTTAARAVCMSSHAAPSSSSSSSAAVVTEDTLRTEEMLRHLQEERQRLLGVVSHLEEDNTALQSQITDLQSDLQSVSRDKNHDLNAAHLKQKVIVSSNTYILSSDHPSYPRVDPFIIPFRTIVVPYSHRTILSSISVAYLTCIFKDREREILHADLMDAKREVDLKTVENEALKAEIKGSKQRIDALREIQVWLLQIDPFVYHISASCFNIIFHTRRS